MVDNMELKEAKEILNKAGFLMENYDEELKNAIEIQVGNNFWKKYYDRIMSNEEMVQFIDDTKDELSPDEMAEKLLDWDDELNEDFTQGVRGSFRCRPRHSTFYARLCSSYDEIR